MVVRNTKPTGSTAVALEDVLVDFFESQQQAQHDFGGEQREWHLPRLNRVAKALMILFPTQAVNALERVKSPYDA